MDTLKSNTVTAILVIVLFTIGLSGTVAAQSSGGPTLDDRVVAIDDETVTLDIESSSFVDIKPTLPENWSVSRTTGPGGSAGSQVDGAYSWISGGSGTYTIQLAIPADGSGQSADFKVATPSGEDTFTVTAVSNPVSVKDKLIPTDGGKVTVNVEAGSFVDINTSQLPAGWTVSDPTPDADVLPIAISWISISENDSYSFKLNPPQDVSSGTKVTFTVTADTTENSDTFAVTTTAKHQSGASEALVDSVAGSDSGDSSDNADEELSRLEILKAWDQYLDKGNVNGTPVEDRFELLKLWDWYKNTQA